MYNKTLLEIAFIIVSICTVSGMITMIIQYGFKKLMIKIHNKINNYVEFTRKI